MQSPTRGRHQQSNSTTSLCCMQQFSCLITPSTPSQSCNCTQRWHGSSRVVAPDCARFVSSAGSRFGTALGCAKQQDPLGCHSCRVYLYILYLYISLYCPIIPFRQESSKCIWHITSPSLLMYSHWAPHYINIIQYLKYLYD